MAIRIIKHGETDINKENLLNSDPKIGLNDSGIEQVSILRDELRHSDCYAIYISPSKAAEETANILTDGVKGGIQVIKDDRLRGINYGEFEGQKETPETVQDFFYAAQKGRKRTEKFDEFINRTIDFRNYLLEQYGDTDKDILVVTHSANALALDFVVKGMPENYNWTRRLGNCEMRYYNSLKLSRFHHKSQRGASLSADDYMEWAEELGIDSEICDNWHIGTPIVDTTAEMFRTMEEHRNASDYKSVERKVRFLKQKWNLLDAEQVALSSG